MAKSVLRTVFEIIVTTIAYGYDDDLWDDFDLVMKMGSGVADNEMMIYYHDYEFKNRFTVVNRVKTL